MLLTKRNRFGPGGRGQRGFTLTELMIALVIMGLIMSVVYKVFSSQDRFFRNQEQIASMQENLRATMEYINQELSWLGYRVPGIAVIKAAPTDIIFKANIPNTGTTIQYVRYQFDASTNTIRRAAGANQTFVENADLTVMASDIESVGFSYFNVLNGLVTVTAGDPLCADELNATVCAPGTPDDDASLLMVQRVKARVTARTSKPDWQYTDPEGGSNPNYRKRRAVLDLRARNVEDVTLQGGQIVIGECGYLTHSITIPTPYSACEDKLYQLTNYRPSPANNTWDDNPSITIQAYDKDGNLNTNANSVTYVYAVAGDGTPYNIYDPVDPYTVDNTIANGEIRYVSAQELSTVATGTDVSLRFAYSDGLCTQVSYDGDTTITIAPNPASYFETGTGYVGGGLTLDYVDNAGSPITLATPDRVAMCSTVGNERVLLGAKLMDDCQNPISGETIAWTDGGFGGSFVNETDNGDGTYSATYIPPDTVATPAAVTTGTLGAQWGSYTPNVNVEFIAAEPHDIVIDSIVDVTQAGIFQYSASVLPRASQLGGNSGNSFSIERIDGQEVMVRFHIEDACGNRVFTETSNITGSASTGSLAFLASYPDGTYSYSWESNIGCGLETLGENITISVSSIAEPSTQTETVSFDLLTTRSSDPSAGPFVLIDVSPLGDRLQAGNTGDFVNLQATVSQYHPEEQYCTNVPGVFPVEFSVTGDVGGNGSFSNAAPFNDTSVTVNTTALGVAEADLYSGTADWDDTVTVTATATIEGATYAGNVSVTYDETNHPQDDSGFYQDDLYTTEIGLGQSITTFGPGQDLYLQIFDYDENENPNAQDSFPPINPDVSVFVTVESTLTGDLEEVGLSEELSGNSPKFRKTLPTAFFSSTVTALELGDGTLQVRDGDTITMHYEDKDNPGDADDWTVYTPGADYFRLFKVGSPDQEITPPPGPAQTAVAYNDKLRPELSLPFLAGDGRTALDTVQITLDSGADTDTLTLRENGDTGVMVPDDTIYTGQYFSVAQTDPGDAADVLLTPTTPRYVTLEYDVAGSYARSLTFFMKDFDPPEVVITSPVDTDVVSGLVTVQVEANDVANATTWSGISRVDFYVNDRLVSTYAPGGDITGTTTFTWTTAVGSTPYWLDGSHTLTAVAYDASNNQAESLPVGVTVDNNLSPIWFNKPSYNSIWSQGMDVQLEVGNLAAQSGTHQLTLYVNSVVAATFTVDGPGVFNHTVDTTSLPEGKADLIAIIRDLQNNPYQTAALDFIVDRQAPSISIGTPPAWVSLADFPLDVDVTIYDQKVAPADPNDADDSTVVGTFSGICSSSPIAMSEVPAGGDTYNLFWAGPCPNRTGSITLTVGAYDIANSPNYGETSVTTSIDTRRPTVDSVNVIPMVNQSFVMGSWTFDGFVRGSVTLNATASDAYLNSGLFVGLFVNDPGAPSINPDWADFMAMSPYLDASTGTFSSPWNTGSYGDGIFVISAGVTDAAGNSSQSPPYRIVYVDNGIPWTAAPTIYLPMGIARGPVYVMADSEANDGFLKTVEHRFVRQGGDPGNSFDVIYSEVFNYPAQSMTRTSSKTYVLDTSSWENGFYEGYSYVADWAGNTYVSGSSGPFEVSITRLEAGSVSATFAETSPGSGQFQMTATGRLVDANGYPVSGENLHLLAYRYINSCLDSTCSSTTSSVVSESDYTVYTDGSGNFTYTPSLVYENPVPGVTTADTYYVYIRDVNNKYYGYAYGYLDDPPLQAFPYQYVYLYRQGGMISNLSTRLDPYGLDYRITVSGNLIRADGQPAEYVPLRFRVRYYDTFSGTYEYDPSSGYNETTTGSYGAFSYQAPTALPAGSYYFYVYLYDDSYNYLGYLYQPGPTPGTVMNYLY